MNPSQQELLQFVKENDVKFIRLAFCDLMGTQKNIAIMTDEIVRCVLLFALRGKMLRVSHRTYLLAPSTVDVVNSIEMRPNAAPTGEFNPAYRM